MSTDDKFDNILGYAGRTTIVVTLPEPLVKGNMWYVKYPGAEVLSQVTIEDVTAKTVLIRPYWPHAALRHNPASRYKLGDIEFVERTFPPPTPTPMPSDLKPPSPHPWPWDRKDRNK